MEQHQPRGFGHRCRINGIPQGRQIINALGNGKGAGNIAKTTAFLFRQFKWVQHAKSVDHAVGQFRGDDFLAQPVSQNRRLMRFDHHVRECRQKFAVHRLVLRQRGFLNPILRRKLCCGEQYRQFWPR